MIKSFTISFLLLVCSAFPQSNKFGFDFDYAQFGYDTTSNYVQVYYDFDQNDLTVHKTDTANYVQGVLSIAIMDSVKGDTVLDRSWSVVHNVSSDTAVQNKSLVGVLSLVMHEGIYRFIIAGKDAGDSLKVRKMIEYIHVKPFIGKKASISDIEFASRIIQDSPDTNSIFYKNTYEVIPSPSSVFGGNQPVLFYYSELYNMKFFDKNDPLTIKQLIYNSNGKLVNKKEGKINNDINSRVDVGVLPVNKLPTDSYTFVEALIDNATKFGISSTKRFYVYNPEIVNKDTSILTKSEMLSSEFNTMTKEELDNLFQEAKYIATNTEINKYGKLTTLEGKRKFMYDFWKSRDPDPSTPRNEYYLDYMKRVQVSNEKYGTLGMKGWQTDRGRVYLTYGEPSEIDRYPNESNTKPYEIWHYNDIEGGVIFVFADLTGFSQYTLVNSTKRGELSDDNWQQRITTN
jgi:GWxTD domain-containing protein